MMLKNRALAINSAEHGWFVWVYKLSEYAYRDKIFYPRKMMIRRNSENTSSKKFYGSKNHLVGISNTDRILKSIVLDLYYGTTYIFDTKDECMKSFRKKTGDVAEYVETVKISAINDFNDIIAKYKGLMSYDK